MQKNVPQCVSLSRIQDVPLETGRLPATFSTASPPSKDSWGLWVLRGAEQMNSSGGPEQLEPAEIQQLHS